MTDPRLEDHVVGLELQLVELVERRERAVAQGRTDDAAAIAAEIDEVQRELIVSAEAAASDRPAPQADVRAEPAEIAAFSLLDDALPDDASSHRRRRGGLRTPRLARPAHA